MVADRKANALRLFCNFIFVLVRDSEGGWDAREEINTHIMNIHHGLSQLDTLLFGDSGLDASLYLSLMSEVDLKKAKKWKGTIKKVQSTSYES